jgi:hypothetical protein
MKTLPSVLSVAVLLAAVLSSCSAPVEPDVVAAPRVDSEAFLGPEEAGAEYLETIADFPEPLPHGQDFPTTVPAQLNEDANHGFGAGKAPAYLYWRCAWSHEYLVAFNNGDQAQMTTVLEVLARWPQTVFYRDHVIEQPGAGWQEMVIEPAQRGDPTMMRQMDSADCQLYRRVQAAQG